MNHFHLNTTSLTKSKNYLQRVKFIQSIYKDKKKMNDSEYNALRVKRNTNI